MSMKCLICGELTLDTMNRWRDLVCIECDVSYIFNFKNNLFAVKYSGHIGWEITIFILQPSPSYTIRTNNKYIDYHNYTWDNTHPRELLNKFIKMKAFI